MKPAPRRSYRESKPLSPEEQKKRDEEAAAMMKKWQEEAEAERREQERVDEVLKMLEIPHSHNNIDAHELVDILMDEKKVHAILTKVRNKAFW